MAQQEKVTWVDDLDGASTAAETVRFALDGTEYAIDLSEEHAREFREELSLYTGNASRRTEKRRHARGANVPEPPDIRDWARSRGYVVRDNWAVPRRIIGEYNLLVSLSVIKPGS